MTCQEVLLRNRARERLGWTVTPSRCANLQNPTLTIMALCVRSCDYLIGEMKRGNI